jgi:hypothetical protein
MTIHESVILSERGLHEVKFRRSRRTSTTFLSGGRPTPGDVLVFKPPTNSAIHSIEFVILSEAKDLLVAADHNRVPHSSRTLRSVGFRRRRLARDAPLLSLWENFVKRVKATKSG